MRASPTEQLLTRARAGDTGPVLLVTGDRVLSEPAAQRLGEALAEAAGCELTVHRRPPDLGPVLTDLRTFGLFAAAKVVLVVETGLLADREAAAAFVDEAAAAAPVEVSGDGPPELSRAERDGALRLLQAIRLFDQDPYQGEPEAVLGGLPDWAFQGVKGPGKRRRSKKQGEKVRESLVSLLAAARALGLQGFAEEEVSELSRVVREGLPAGHVLILAESAAASDHPVVQALEERGAVLARGSVSADRGGDWKGIEELAVELGRQTGVPMDGRAVDELARRTLRKASSFGADSEVSADSTARFAGEYRKLAHLARGEGKTTIDRALVLAGTEDRGEQDVFKILDAVGAGNAQQAMGLYHRYLESAADRIAARLSFFGLLAGFCRNLTAIGGALVATGAPAGVSHYGRFKSQIAPTLQKNPDGFENPLAKLHPYRLHRAYLAASAMAPDRLARLPWRVLEVERRLKGGSGEPDAALAELLAEVSSMAAAPRGRSGGRRR